MSATGPRIFGSHEPSTLARLADVASRAAKAALRADGHQQVAPYRD